MKNAGRGLAAALLIAMLQACQQDGEPPSARLLSSSIVKSPPIHAIAPGRQPSPGCEPYMGYEKRDCLLRQNNGAASTVAYKAPVEGR